MTPEMLQQYSVIVQFLGKTLGPDYEIVLHDYKCFFKNVNR